MGDKSKESRGSDAEISDFELNSLIDAMKNNDTKSDFEGFKDSFNFQTCVLSALTLGVILFVLSIFPSLPTSCLAFFVTLTTYTWFKLYGINMTRKEVVYFHVAKLMELAPRCEYENSGSVDDCNTPGDGTAEKPPPGPSTIWEALFADDKKLRMDQFYKEHYGPVYATSKKNYAEYLNQRKAAEREQRKQKQQ